MTETAAPDPLDEVLSALVELIRTGTGPDVVRAQRLLLQRLSEQGDVVPSRVPPPADITQVGGYLNLLAADGQTGLRTAAVASALGLAAPRPAPSDDVAAGFVELVNDRPPGPARLGIPVTVTVRADRAAPLQQALDQLRALGGALPLRSVGSALPAPGAIPGPGAQLDRLLLDVLGRRLGVWPTTVLVDPAVDPLAVGRPENPPGEPLRLLARVPDDRTTVARQGWVVLRASAAGTVTEAVQRRYVEVAPVMSTAGWEHPSPLRPPSGPPTAAAPDAAGTLVQFQDVTALLPGVTTLGEELARLYTPSQVARSALAGLTSRVWDGSTFG